MIIHVFTLIIICRLTYSQNPTSPVITENGPVIGITTYVSSDPVYKFLGIPYARPPTGNLRFKKPEPAVSWTNNYHATKFGSSCMQPGSTKSSEDCLYLNIFTPTLINSANLSVMFWIHGGGFTLGSGAQLSNVVFDGSQLAIRNVVVVTINYRLGVFGFLYGNSSEAPGNIGLWDQVMALNWTARNIASFGGNPNDITLFGANAGGVCISNLIVSNPCVKANNLFRKAIILSGTAYNIIIPESAKYAYSLARSYATNAFISKWNKCPNNDNWIECLKSKSAVELINAQANYTTYTQNRSFAEFIQFTTIFGDELVPISAKAAVKHGYFRQDLRLLISHTEMEGQYFTQQLDNLHHLNGRYTSNVERPSIISKRIVRNDMENIIFANIPFRETISNAYTDVFDDLSVTLNPQPIRRSASFSIGDGTISCPTVLFGAYIAKWKTFTGKVYQSRLTYASTQSIARNSVWANVTTGDDLPLLFGAPVTNASQWIDDDRYLSNKIMDYYTYFAKYGVMPTVNPIFGVWPSYAMNDGCVNVSYVELHADINRLGRVFINRYRGNDGYTPSVIYDCFNFWDPLSNSQFD